MSAETFTSLAAAYRERHALVMAQPRRNNAPKIPNELWEAGASSGLSLDAQADLLGLPRFTFRERRTAWVYRCGRTTVQQERFDDVVRRADEIRAIVCDFALKWPGSEAFLKVLVEGIKATVELELEKERISGRYYLEEIAPWTDL